MTANLHDVFVSLRAILQPYGSRRDFLQSDSGERFTLSSAKKTDRIGRPLFIAAVEANARYVSYHLIPIYMNPALQSAVPPGLKKRMHGKSCFNFTSIDGQQLQELAALTEQAIASFKDVTLPWDGKRS